MKILTVLLLVLSIALAGMVAAFVTVDTATRTEIARLEGELTQSRAQAAFFGSKNGHFSISNDWIGKPHVARVKADGAVGCFDCHEEIFCSDCHVNLD